MLDEPTTALDTEARHAVWDAIRAHARGGGTILLTTHNLEEADALAGRVILLERGAVVADGATAAIKAAAGLTCVRFRMAGNALVRDARRVGDYVELFVPDGGEAVAELVRSGVRLDDLEVRALSLEEAIAVRGAR